MTYPTTSPVVEEPETMAASPSNPVKLLFADRADFRSLHQGESASFGVIGGLYAVAILSLGAVWSTRELSLSAALPIYALAFVAIGWTQYSLGNGMHEAVHHNLLNRRSDWLASVLTAYPIGLTMSYRSFHLAHHQFLGTDKDPELDVYTTFPGSKPQLILRFVWFASGIPAGLQFLSQQASGRSPRSYAEPLTFLAVQAVIAAAFTFAFGNPLYYVAFWILPIATVGKLLSSTRLMCEHGSPDRPWVVRTISGPRWQTWVLGAFDFNYHGEHHLFPSIPYASLRQLHERHKAYALAHPEYRPFEGRLEFFDGGYLGLLAKWMRELPWRAAR